MTADSEVSEVDDDDDDIDESLLDRLTALKDIVPPTYRKHISNAASKGYSFVSSVASLSGKTLWVVSTSALLLGVPWALAFSEEQQVQEMEREMRMQQSANEVRQCHRNGGMAVGRMLTKRHSFSLLEHQVRPRRNRLCRASLIRRVQIHRIASCVTKSACSDCIVFSAQDSAALSEPMAVCLHSTCKHFG